MQPILFSTKPLFQREPPEKEFYYSQMEVALKGLFSEQKVLERVNSSLPLG
jgi:hypothetical protein